MTNDQPDGKGFLHIRAYKGKPFLRGEMARREGHAAASSARARVGRIER